MQPSDKEKYVYFWSINDPIFGCFSQWYQTEFEEDGVTFNCSEQYMMAKKAILFDDKKILAEIMATDCPKKMKSLGRKINNFNPDIWEQHRKDIVYCGNLLKFGYNTQILNLLLRTGNSIIAEASPYDKIWGIGRKKSAFLTKKDWNGQNLLGYILMEVREFYR